VKPLWSAEVDDALLMFKEAGDRVTGHVQDGGDPLDRKILAEGAGMLRVIAMRCLGKILP